MAKSKQALMVDDSPSERVLIRACLERTGFLVSEAHNGDEGLALARDRSFDLVITDVLMPYTNGIDMLKNIRALPEYSDVPFIVVAADTSRTALHQGVDIGVRLWLPKPIVPKLLMEALRRM